MIEKTLDFEKQGKKNLGSGHGWLSFLVEVQEHSLRTVMESLMACFGEEGTFTSLITHAYTYKDQWSVEF